MIRCTQNLMKIENEVGTKQKRFEDNFYENCKTRDTLDVELEGQKKEMDEMEKKSPEFNFEQFKDYCAMKVTRQNMQKERMLISRNIFVSWSMKARI